MPASSKTVLGVALRKGGDFAEVFVEDRRSSGISLDDRKVEEAVIRARPRCRHQGGGG